MNVVITIDDLGLHPAVRRAAVHLADRGRATSVSLLVNGPDRDNCLDLEGLGVGVQLNVFQGRPVSEQHNVSSMLRQDGCFVGEYDALLRKFLDGKVQLGQIEQEWATQIEFVLDHGIQPTHLASHGGMHAWPGLMAVIGKLAKRYGVGWVRRPLQCENILSSGPRNHAQFMNICTMLQRLPETVRTTDLVWGKNQEKGDGLAMSFMADAASLDSDAVVEIVGRPGMPEQGDGELAAPFTPGPSRVDWGSALAAMESSQWRMVWDKLDLGPQHFENMHK